MTEEKKKRSLRRLHRRLASLRRRRMAHLRNRTGRDGFRVASKPLPHTTDVLRGSGHGVEGRLPTRQELRVQEEFEYATEELGLA